MRIVDVRTHVLLDPGFDVTATSSAQDAIVVEIVTDEGIVGVGETDLNAWIARACIEAPGTHTMDRGLKALLLGRNPLDPVARWEELYVGTAMSGRRGAVVHALGALDMALWDICGKAAGKPVWQLLGAQAEDALVPYASLQPEVSTFDAYRMSMVEWAQQATAMGFRAIKVEATFSGPYAHRGLAEPDERITELLEAVRSNIPKGVALLVDVQYAFDSVQRARAALEAWADLDIFFVETPLWADDLAGYAELCHESVIPIAAGEWLATRFEFLDLMDVGNVQVIQPDIGRVGGITEAVRVLELARTRGRTVVPHAWKTGISVAAAAHLAAVTPHMPLFEFLPPSLCKAPLRRELVVEELQLENGLLRIPELPGLGVELDRSALAYFSEAAARV